MALRPVVRTSWTYETAHDRHLQVHQDDVEIAILLELANGSSTVLHDDHIVAVLLESLLNDHAVDQLYTRASA